MTLNPPLLPLPRCGSLKRIFLNPPHPGHHRPSSRVLYQYLLKLPIMIIPEIILNGWSLVISYPRAVLPCQATLPRFGNSQNVKMSFGSRVRLVYFDCKKGSILRQCLPAKNRYSLAAAARWQTPANRAVFEVWRTFVDGACDGGGAYFPS